MTNIQEIWRPITEFADDYEISNLGRVRAIFRWVPQINHGVVFRRSRKERICTPFLNESGYYVINIPIKRVTKIRRIHRLVALHFIPNPENKPFINHINGVKTDNRIENLEWCTPQENVHHAIRIGLMNNRGEKNGRSKLSEQDVLKIYNSIGTHSSIAINNNVCVWTVSLIKRGKLWNHITNHIPL